MNLRVLVCASERMELPFTNMGKTVEGAKKRERSEV
jgi:hypothetical protein